MADRREMILARLEAIAQSFDGFTTVGRNLVDLPDDALPALVVVDGDEETIDDAEGVAKRPPAQHRLMQMRPEIVAILIGAPEALGPDLQGLRAKMVSAVLSDTTLKSASYVLHERMTYEGCETQGGVTGRGVVCGMRMNFTFTYLFRPTDLVA